MPLDLDLKLPNDVPKPDFLTLQNFKNGVITLIDESRLPKTALKEARNIFLVEDGQPSPRPGVAWYGDESPNAATIDGFDYFDADGSVHLVIVAGGNVYRSTDNGDTWTICTGATLTSDVTVNMNQNAGFLYLTNGVDPITRYDGTTTLQTYTGLTKPGAPTVTETAALTGAGFTYYYKVSAVNEVGFTEASNEGSTTVDTARDNWDATTESITISSPSVANADRYDFYISEDDVNYFYVGSSATTDFKDDGTAIISPGTVAPVDNTTTGPLVEELVNVGIRMYGIRDTENRYRIWFTGSGVYAGAFASAFDGGYLDWQEGGKFIPQQVADYRDGRGTPFATIWCSSADGQGSVLQMSLETLTIGDISITVPSAYQLPGSRGTPAPGSVVNVLNDYMYYNSQAFYNIGSRANLQQILSTDEASSNIRPTVKRVTTSAESGIASIYFDAKVYFSVPIGDTENNTVIVYDTERRAWLPEAFTIGFSKFLRYTDTTGSQKLLALKPGDTRLSEISNSINGDYGEAFATSLVTGLYPTVKNRFEFQWTEEGEVEFSNPQGTINIELLGIERSQGFSSTNTETIQPTLTNTGWNTFAWNVSEWNDTSDVPDTFSESSVKRYFNVQEELNAVQWRITTNAKNARYVLRTLQSWGTPTNAGKPQSWKL